jgi:hypothetical protein
MTSRSQGREALLGAESRKRRLVKKRLQAIGLTEGPEALFAAMNEYLQNPRNPYSTDQVADHTNASGVKGSTVHPVKNEKSLRDNSWLDSAVIFAAATFLFFAWGLVYQLSFYSRLGIADLISIDSPYVFAFSSARFAIIVVTALWISTLHFLEVKSESRWTAFLSNLTLMVFFGMLLESSLSLGNYWSPGIVLCGLSIVCLIFLTFKRTSLLRLIVRSGDRNAQLVFFLIPIVALYFVANENGRFEAERTIAGQSINHPIIELSLRDSGKDYSGQRFGLAAIDEGRYFLVQLESPVPEVPVILIIPETEISSVATGSGPSSAVSPQASTPHATPET